MIPWFYAPKPSVESLAYLDHSLEPQSKQKRVQLTYQKVTESVTKAYTLFSESSLGAYSLCLEVCFCQAELSDFQIPHHQKKRSRQETERCLLISILTANINDIHSTNNRGTSIRSRGRQKNSNYSGLKFIHDPQ